MMKMSIYNSPLGVTAMGAGADGIMALWLQQSDYQGVRQLLSTLSAKLFRKHM